MPKQTVVRSSTDKARILAEILLLVTILIWAGNNSLAKWTLGGMTMFQFNSIRYVVASLFLGSLFLVRARWLKVEPGDWKKILLVGFLAGVAYQMAFISGLSLTTVGNCSVLLATSPIWTIITNRVILKEAIRPMVITGMVTSFIGVGMIIFGTGTLDVGAEGILGDFLCLFAATLWGLSSTLQKPLLARYSAIQLNVVIGLMGGMVFSVVAFPSFVAGESSALAPGYFFAAVVSGAFSIGLANTFWSFGVKKLGPAHASNFANLVPVFALAIAYIALGEKLLLLQLIGAGVTLVGVWLARK